VPLVSQLFKGDKKLEAALVKDPAHVTIGAKGQHVAKIQMALFAIDWLTIDQNELRLQAYGKSTAKAVYSYKRRRKIINFSYQAAEDNIVGKMTMRRLDLEMMLYEQSHRAVDECSVTPSPPPQARGAQPVRGLVAAPAVRKEVVGKPGRKPQLGRVLHVMCAITKRSSIDDGFPLRKHLERAREQLFEFGLTLSVEFKSNGFADTIDFVDKVILDEHVGLMRQASENTRQGFDKVLRIIVCQRGPRGDPGETFRNIQVGPKVYAPFILLNSQNQARDDATLLHEMIHASHKQREIHDEERDSVFFRFAPVAQESPDRTFLREDRAIQLSKAFFAF
jgi:hypothetical protein